MPNNFLLAEDKTGININNLISNEEHILDSNNYLLIPNYLTYFTSSIVVKAVDSLNNEITLQKEVDFLTLDFNAKLSSKIGEELCSTILLIDKKNCNKFKINYQAYGGFTNPNYTELINSIKNLTNTVMVDWKDILNKPATFPVKNPHTHIWKDVYGMEYLVDTINRLIDSIENSPSLTDLNLPTKIANYFNSIPVIDKPILNNTHATSIDNFHKLNKTQIGLSNIENYKVLNDYVTLQNASQASEATLNKEFKNRKQLRYLTNNVAYNYIQEILNLQIQELNNTINNYNNRLLTVSNSLTANQNTFNTNQTVINNTTNNLSDANSNKNTIKNNFKQYRLFSWNYEIAKISKQMLEKEYLISSNYNDIFNVLEYIDLPYLWLDFSDSSKITLDVNNKIISILDKSYYGRIFNQSNALYRPSITNNTFVGSNEINRNTSALFNQNSFLQQQISNNQINLNRNFSIVLLTKTTNTINCILSSTQNNNYLYSNKNTKSFSLETSKYFIDTVNNSSNDNKTMLSFINVCDDGIGVTFSNSNIANNNIFLSNINSNNKFNINDILFDCIGDKNRLINHNLNLCELMIFDRLISKEEIITINSYLSRKWSGSTDFSIDLTNLNSL